MDFGKKWKQILLWAGAAALGLALLRFCLPLILPFLVGLLAALGAEPLTRLLARKLPRPLASGLSMGAAYSLLCLGLYLLGRGLLGELNRLTGELPALAEGAQALLHRAEDFLYFLADKAPEHLRSQAEEGLRGLFASGTRLAGEAMGRLLGILTRGILRLPDTLLFLLTAITSGFLISARLPRLVPWVKNHLPQRWRQGAVQVMGNIKGNLGLWVKAECKLMGVTFCLLLLGFLLLPVKRPLVAAVLVTLVDALPVLGIGTVLLPWAFIALLQGKTALALGLCGLYGVAALSRSLLEPRMVGRQLGLSPLLTLGAIYAGYRLWGIMGMILAPVLVIAAGELVALTREQS